ncbi:MAG: redoxin domain-containing protein [Gemmatimonadaceae bacterium]|nr:redoxin domain-containing protein [Gemmatimonadaceae bacterium]
MNWKRSAVAAAVAAPFIVLLAWGLTKDPREIPSPLPGRQAPEFALEVFIPGEGAHARNVGDTVSLAALRGKVVVLNFWASWCLECVTEHQDLSLAARQLAGKPVQFVGVLYNDVKDAGRQWVAQRGGEAYPALDDPGARAAIDYGLYGVPETFVIDPSGKIAYKHTGPIWAGLLTAKVDSILAAATPAASGPKGE